MGHAKLSPIDGLSAIQVRDAIAEGQLWVADLAEKLVAFIRHREPEIHAFAYFDPDFVMKQAQALDAWKRSGHALGPLHGVPVVLKDIIDTAGMATENGISLDAGRVPREDATLVSKLKASGALILGKSKTTPLAFMDPTDTTNPHAADRTPGGSSSGSAAAVAAGMACIGIGTQTGGSVIRPASFCGVVGMKPTFGLISRQGVLAQSPFLDTVGVFGQSVEDVALTIDVLSGYDSQDSATPQVPQTQCYAICQQKVPVHPAYAFIELPGMEHASESMRVGLSELETFLGEHAFATNLPRAFEEAMEARKTINYAEMAKCYYRYKASDPDHMPPSVLEAMVIGESILARDYLAALDWRTILDAALDELFERADVLVCPAATGEAPGVETTGDPRFNGIWTLTGHPSVTVPLLTGESGLPMGVQLIGPRNDDARLLRAARHLCARLASETEETT